jgi:hypothetical protein
MKKFQVENILEINHVLKYENCILINEMKPGEKYHVTVIKQAENEGRAGKRIPRLVNAFIFLIRKDIRSCFLRL